MRADIKYIQVMVPVAAVGLDPAGLRTEQLNGQGIGPILEEAETVECPE
jgi:hypothetical protein